MLHRHLHKARRQLLSPKKLKLRLVFWSSAILIGAVAALFALLSHYSDNSFKWIFANYPLIALSLPPLGLALVAWLTKRFFPGAEGSGIPQAIAAMQTHQSGLRHAVLSIRIAIGKILLACMGLFAGASIGREGPTVHIGASILHAMRRYFPIRSHEMTRALIMAGGAAGISAAFNTPLAGLLFAIEEMSRNYEQRTSGTVLLAVVLAGVTALIIQGDYIYFGQTDATMSLVDAWPVVLICGVAGGLIGGLFSQTLIYGSRRLLNTAQRHPVQLAFACGIVVSIAGYFSQGQSFGTGYTEARELVTASISPDQVQAGFPFWKMLATTFSYWSGIPGGIFAPSLSVGAGLGADLAFLFPALPFAAIVILAMVGYFTGVVQTPITAFVIIMEMTSSHDLLLPLMATALLARGASSLVCPKPIYQALAENFLRLK